MSEDSEKQQRFQGDPEVGFHDTSFVENHRYEFSDSELADLGQQYIEAQKKAQRVESSNNIKIKGLKGDIASAKSEADSLFNKINTGYETITLKVYMHRDLERGKMLFVAKDGRIVKERDLTPTERQLSFDVDSEEQTEETGSELEDTDEHPVQFDEDGIPEDPDEEQS